MSHGREQIELLLLFLWFPNSYCESYLVLSLKMDFMVFVNYPFLQKIASISLAMIKERNGRSLIYLSVLFWCVDRIFMYQMYTISYRGIPTWSALRYVHMRGFRLALFRFSSQVHKDGMTCLLKSSFPASLWGSIVLPAHYLFFNFSI